jgi:hypothetical protein
MVKERPPAQETSARRAMADHGVLWFLVAHTEYFSDLQVDDIPFLVFNQTVATDSVQEQSFQGEEDRTGRNTDGRYGSPIESCCQLQDPWP